MLIDYQHDADSIILRVKLLDSSLTTGGGLTGLTSSSAGLIISTIADNEATPTTYTQAGSTVETIATLGTYAAPTATKCRFKEVDATNHPGVYEIQLADARFAVASAKSLLIAISGATNCAETDAVIPLRGINPFDSVRGGMTALPNAAPDAAGGLPISDAGGLDMDTLASMWTTALTEAYAADGAEATPAQLLYLIQQALTEFIISGTTMTVRKLDGSTTAASLTLNSATTPTSVTRSG